MRVIVVGAGVVGLTCAIRLAEAGLDVDVLARDLPGETTSDVAAAFWSPCTAEPRERVAAWSRTSFTEFGKLGKRLDCINLRHGVEYLQHREPNPWWADAVVDLERITEVPPDGFTDGWRFTTPVIEMPAYLRYLARRLEDAGGTITRSALSALPNHAPVVVNCSGIGAKYLAADDNVRPVRGQVVYVRQVGLENWTVAWPRTGPVTYVIPRTDDIVIGGTYEPGDWNLEPDEFAEQQMLQRAARLVPELADVEVLGRNVGLRPARDTVRCEAVMSADSRSLTVHCYGHGGCGVTMSWGCADEVFALVNRYAPAPTLF